MRRVPSSPIEELSSQFSLSAFIEAIAWTLDDRQPVIGWDDSLAHDHLFGGDDFDELANRWWKDYGVTVPEAPMDWIGVSEGTFLGAYELLRADRMSIAYLAQVFDRKAWFMPGQSEREIRVEALVDRVWRLRPRKRLCLRHGLWADLQLSADDLASILRVLAGRFDLPPADVDVGRFTRADRAFWRARASEPEMLRVRDLIPYVLEGKWSEPGTRDDLLIAWRQDGLNIS